MKNFYSSLKLIMIIFIIHNLLSCKKVNEEPEELYYWGEINALKNNSAWTGNIGGSELYNLFHIYIVVFNSEDQRAEDLNITKFPKLPGFYPILKTDTLNKYLLPSASYFTLQDDGDVILDIYSIDPNTNNSYIEITFYDNNSEIIEGNFNLTFVRDDSRKKIHSSIPDTIRFINGKFKTKILNKYD